MRSEPFVPPTFNRTAVPPGPVPPEPTALLNVNPETRGLAFRGAGASRLAAFVGPYGVGKDHAAEAMGFTQVVKFAGPLYRLAEELAGRKVDKSEPGWRKTLCQLGAWGRGEVTEEWPMTAERALLCYVVRNLDALPGFGDFHGFGTSPNFWRDRAISTALNVAHNYGHVAITDARYPNEIDECLANDFMVYFVACRTTTLEGRRQRLGYPLRSSDQSEKVANDLFTRVTIDARAPEDPLIRVLWSDTPETCPGFAIPLFVR